MQLCRLLLTALLHVLRCSERKQINKAGAELWNLNLLLFEPEFCHAHLRFAAADFQAELTADPKQHPATGHRSLHTCLPQRCYLNKIPVEAMPLQLVVTGYTGLKGGNGVQTQTSSVNAFDQCAIQDHNAQLCCVQGHVGQGMGGSL